MTDRTKFAWKQSKSGMLSAVVGMGIGMSMSLIGSDPTWKTWMYWGIASVVIIGLTFFIPYLTYKQR